MPANTIIKFVPQQEAWIVERMGKFQRVLQPGLAILIPFIDKIQYVQSLKEVALEVPSQSAITSDNVTLDMDGVLYYRVVEPYKASYGVEDAQYAIVQLAQTTMRSEIGQMSLDLCLRERTVLNSHITVSINEAAQAWGIQVLRYEIRDIRPPVNVVNSMNQVVEKDREKRAVILESEGRRQSEINVSEAHKISEVLNSEGEMSKRINLAKGAAEAVNLQAQADAQAIRTISKAITDSPGGKDAVSLHVAERYVDAFGKLAKETNTLILPSNLDNFSQFIAAGMGIYNSLDDQQLAKKVLAAGKAVDKPKVTSGDQ
ncbi:DEKNAAC102842 [Brettanomyces naardenensis]|uniref:DEKNAAC102842 n=1 Tax=Brettanomyces naardenensis TaxID=13370 RepID=A0A448YLS7_BRENA|nr:DEKNAAC102842 [Brettanomyces naardenensis]